jgi:hypothetical protein
MEDVLTLFILFLARFAVPLAVMTLVAVLYSRLQHRHVR